MVQTLTMSLIKGKHQNRFNNTKNTTNKQINKYQALESQFYYNSRSQTHLLRMIAVTRFNQVQMIGIQKISLYLQ